LTLIIISFDINYRDFAAWGRGDKLESGFSECVSATDHRPLTTDHFSDCLKFNFSEKANASGLRENLQTDIFSSLAWRRLWQRFSIVLF
jgi:hypothetical protein